MSRSHAFGCWVGSVLMATAAARPGLALDASKAMTQYVYDQWTTKEGLPHVWASCLAQTRDGYLWIGMSVGLVRFDGQSFRLFDRSNARGLVGRNVVALLAARDGSLWVSCLGAGLSRMKDGEFVGFTRADGLPHHEIFCLAEDPEGRVWIGSEGGLAYIQGGRITRVGAQEGMADGRVDRVVVGPDGSVWVRYGSGVLLRWKGGRAVPFSLEADGLGPDYASFFWDREGNLWVGHASGLSRFRRGVKTDFPAPSSQYAPPREWAEDRDGNLWMGGWGVGLVRFSPRQGTYARFSAAEGLRSENTSSLLVDREDDVWFGTYGAGIGRLKDGPFRSYSVEEGLVNLPMPNCILPARDGTIWVHFIRFDGTDFEFVPGIDGPACEAPDGSVWFGGVEPGLVRLRDGRFESFPDPDLGRITAVFADRESAVWVGDSRGLVRWKEGRWTRFTSTDGLTSHAILTMAETKDGSLWVGTRDGGLTRILDGVFSRLTTEQGLSSDAVESLWADDDGTLWVGTNGGGLNRVRDGRVVAVYTLRDGLYDDVAFTILGDDEGGLWMGSEKGVFVVQRDDLDLFDRGLLRKIPSRAFGESDGLKSRSIAGHVQSAGRKGPDGRLWFCTIRGISVIDPHASAESGASGPPSTRVEDLVVDGIGRVPARGALVVPPGVRSLSFRYAAPRLRDPARLRFRYKLEGFDGDWVEAGSRREAFYTNLPPGSYRFRVAAADEAGPWGPSTDGVIVRLEPQFYETGAFRVAGIVLFAAAIGALYSARLAGLRLRQRELSRMVLDRTAELEDQSERLRRARADLEAKNRQLAELASLDGLTGLGNRRSFSEALAQQAALAGRRELPLSLALLDVDHFKSFNDSFGHPAGDEVLRTVGDILRRSVRGCDLTARYGGEEFAILLPGAGAAEAVAIADRIRACIAGHDWPLRSITASIGVATLASPSTFEVPDRLVEQADQALYRAKGLGRDRVVHLETDAPLVATATTCAMNV